LRFVTFSCIVAPIQQKGVPFLTFAGRRRRRPIQVFESYAHRDERLRDELEKHLSSLRRSALIDTWYDRRINPGTAFDSAIDGHLASADLILLLISPDFINSDYCYRREMRNALRRHRNGRARVIPIILRPVDWQDTPIGRLLVTPKDGKPVTKWHRRDDASWMLLPASAEPQKS
jgi:hypothetical protein